MDAEQYDTIDFANSKSDSYNATNSDVMSELNAYFKSYIANAEGKKADIQETLDGILNGSTFDDAIEAIHREHSNSSSSSSSSDDEDPDRIYTNDDDVKQNMLDVEILDQHIDKHGLTGGSDATRAIENMAGGGLNADEEELDDFDKSNDTQGEINEFANNMLGMQGGDVRVGKSTAMKGYSGVTDEIRIKGNRVTERSRGSFNYRSEDGRLDMGMLGGSFEDNELDDEQDNVRGPIISTPFPVDMDEESGEKINKDDSEEVTPVHEEYSDYSVEDEAEEEPQDISMASEIDLVLNQLRNKTARTLTGGAVNIRKKVVLTDMYPYIVRS